uniref:hypothetical protein n=1 Tax=Streptomyces kebangsaanensis TaxID=864058 RepID=UPI000AA074EB
LEQLEQDCAGLKADAGHVRDTGQAVHTGFQGLSAYYSAPEAEQLFATTRPVKDRADGFADQLETVSSALSAYATEVRPLADKLKELKARATTFVDSVKDDEKWEYDGDKVEAHNALRDEITATVAAFWAAERTCHNKIVALVPGGTPVVAGDGSDRKDQYGFTAEDMKDAQLPWGDPVEERHHWYEVGHWTKSFVWDGLIVDGVWGTIKGLGTLVGVDGWEAAGQAWKGLGQLATGLVLTAVPVVGAAFWLLPDDKLPSWVRDSRTAMKETGKALVAWDEWGKNPARAAGAVTFNVLTTVFTGGAGGAAAGAGKAGAAAKVLSAAGKAGRALDPMTYVAKGAGAGLSKVGDISKALKGIGTIDIPKLPDNAIVLPEGTVKLADGTVHLPEGTALPAGATKLPGGTVQLPHATPAFPEGTTRLPSMDGSPAQYLDPHGNLLDHEGNVVQHANEAPRELASGADVPRVDSPVREPALVGAGAHTAEQAGQHIRLGDSLDTSLGDVGRTADTAAVHAGGGNVPTVHAGGDGLTGGRVGDSIPVGRAGDNLPTNSLDTHAPAGVPGNAVPGAGTTDHLPGGHADDLGRGPTGSHDLPGGSAADTLPRAGGPTGSGLDELGHVGDEAAGAGDNAAARPEGSTPAQDAEAARPSFMRDGDNPYGPKDSLTPEQVHEIQIYRANHESGYFEDFYKSNGNRKSLELVDESGTTPPQLTRESPQHPWISVKDAPEPLKPHYLGDEIKQGRGTASPEALKTLDEAAANRHHAIGYDTAAGKHKAEAVEVHKHNPTPETELNQLERTYEYKSAHRDMLDHAEAYGENIAEHHVIPEHYPNATREPLDGPLNGNDQFDQVWRREDGGFVVVEAKSNVTTELGARNLPDGKRVSQGTREYFLDIIREMEKRGKRNEAEAELAEKLMDALDEGKLDYIVVKGERNAGEYAGYRMRQFDISDRSTP